MSEYDISRSPYLHLPNEQSADERKLRRFRRLLERALHELREVLRSDVEAACDLDGTVPFRMPRPGTCELSWLEPITRMLTLVRDIEAEIGRPFDHPEPQWLDDLLDGKWELVEGSDPA
jgi:hypothetical protein